MISSFKGKKALLIGNGVNLLENNQSVSWEELLLNLKKDLDINVDIKNTFKPFPLAFDEMLHSKKGRSHFKKRIKNLKKLIRDKIENQLKGKRGFNDYHTKLVTLGYQNILTTNYDYSLQKSISPDFFIRKKDLAQNRQETKHSLKRSYYLPTYDLKIWHIHGELFDSRNLSDSSDYYHEESIMIGYEHYSSYLEKIQENIKGKSGSQKVENQSLMVRLRNEGGTPFWTDIFFTNDIDIVGLGLDFSENHLWWLINHRANTIRNNNSKKELKIDNTIRFYYPRKTNFREVDFENYNNLKELEKKFNEIVKKRNAIQKSKAIAGVLKAFDVEPQPIECESYRDFYNKLIDKYLL